jgi:hypothetical protein
MQKLIAAPRNRDWDRLWETGQEWRKAADGRAANAVQALPALRQRSTSPSKQTGVDAQLQVFEGQSHAQYQFNDQAPEMKQAFGEISAFFDKHLGAAAR